MSEHMIIARLSDFSDIVLCVSDDVEEIESVFWLFCTQLEKPGDGTIISESGVHIPSELIEGVMFNVQKGSEVTKSPHMKLWRRGEGFRERNPPSPTERLCIVPSNC